jgi:DNA repair photolyase
VNGPFGKHVTVKINAVEVLARELDPNRRRVTLKPSYLMLGGGVGDSYQPAEKQYELTRRTLQLLKKYDWPVHILTKSTLVARDLDLITQYNRQNWVIVSFSFSSVNDEISAFVEPHVPPPSERLKTMAMFKQAGIACGIFLLPVIPHITDTPRMIEDAVRKAKEVGIDFVIFGGMTLKEGRQRNYFYDQLKKRRPDLIDQFAHLYKDETWGRVTGEYYRLINRVFNQIARTYMMPRRIPLALFKDILWENDRVVVMLEHLDYFLRLEGKRSSFGYAAYAIAQIDTPLSTMKSELRAIKMIGETTENIIVEILDTKSSTYYEKLASYT